MHKFAKDKYHKEERNQEEGAFLYNNDLISAGIYS